MHGALLARCVGLRWTLKVEAQEGGSGGGVWAVCSAPCLKLATLVH